MTTSPAVERDGNVFWINRDLAEVEINEYQRGTATRTLANVHATVETGSDSGYAQTDNFRLIGTTLPDGATLYHRGIHRALATAYSLHHRFTLAPHDVWQIVLADLAAYIKDNAEACRSLFTTSNDKVEIAVLTGDPTVLPLGPLMDQLRGLVPSDAGLFLPQFTTHTPESRAAMYATFADGLQVYYSYATFCCGLSAVRVLGTDADWAMVTDCLRGIAGLFEPLGIIEIPAWLGRVAGIVDSIRDSLAGGSADFWTDIWTQRNVGSGGQLEISGWFKDLSRNAEPGKAMRLEHLRSGLGIVPYKNLDTGRKFKAAHGCLYSTRDTEGFLVPSYAHAIFEDQRADDGADLPKVYEQPKTATPVKKLYVDSKGTSVDVPVVILKP